MSVQSLTPTSAAPSSPFTSTASAPATVTPPHGQTDAAAIPASASAKQLQQAMEEVRTAVARHAQDLEFSIDQDTGRTVVKVLDGATHELIRQFPSEELLAISRALDRVQGLLLKQKA
jgi:flagellar protein FlaG